MWGGPVLGRADHVVKAPSPHGLREELSLARLTLAEERR